MDRTFSEPQDVKLEFARRKKKRSYAMLLMLLLLIIMAAAGETNLSPIVAGAILAPAIVVLIAAFVYIFRVWRCPACSRFLGPTGTAFGPGPVLRACPKCEVPLV